jgi:hypothetical protein
MIPKNRTVIGRIRKDELQMATGAEDVSAVSEAVHHVIDWWSGTTVPPQVANFLKSHGEDKITDLMIGRTPISATLDLALDVMSGGKYGLIKKKLGYDTFFHLFIVINGKHRIEKNELFNIVPYHKEAGEEDMPIPIRSDQTISQFMANGSKGDETNFYRNYNAFGANCQAMVIRLLSANHLITEPIRHFIKQDVQEFAREHNLVDTSKAITDVGSVVNRLLQLVTGGKKHFSVGGRVGLLMRKPRR